MAGGGIPSSHIHVGISNMLTIITLMLMAWAATPTQGERVYATSKCSMCHSIAGKGNPKGSLDGVGAHLSAEEIRLWLTDPAQMRSRTGATRKPEMKSFASLPKEDLDALITYLLTLKAH